MSLPSVGGTSTIMRQRITPTQANKRADVTPLHRRCSNLGSTHSESHNSQGFTWNLVQRRWIDQGSCSHPRLMDCSGEHPIAQAMGQMVSHLGCTSLLAGVAVLRAVGAGNRPATQGSPHVATLARLRHRPEHSPEAASHSRRNDNTQVRHLHRIPNSVPAVAGDVLLPGEHLE